MTTSPTKGFVRGESTNNKKFLKKLLKGFGLWGMFFWYGSGVGYGSAVQTADQAEIAPASSRQGATPSFAEVCFEDFYLDQPWPTQEQLLSLLAPVAGQEARIEQVHRHQARCCRLVGLWQWRQAWQPGSALRFCLVDMEKFQIHVWTGQKGATFRFYPDFHQTWAAFTARRTGGQPQPETLEFWATDQGRYRRTGIGTLVLYWHEGRLTLARGDCPLVSLPFPDPPQEIYLQGRAVVRGINMFQLSDGPPQETWTPGRSQAASSSIRIDLPRLAWQTGLQQKVRFRALERGGVEWSADVQSGDVQALAPVVPAGMYQWTFQVDSPQPGTGILWANARGEVQARLSFFRDRATGRTTFGLVPGWHREIDRTYEERRPTPWIEGARWFRLVHGAGVAKLFTSPDGILWSQTEPEELRIGEPLTQIGLFCWDRDQPRSVRLGQLSVQRLEVLESLTPAELRQKVAELAQQMDSNSPESVFRASNPEQWDERVLACRPADVPPDRWRRAWIVHCLSQGPIPGWGPSLLYALVREALDETADWQKGLALLEELAWTLPAASDWQAAEQWAGCYDRLGRQAEDQGAVQVWDRVWRSFVGASVWPQRDWPPVLERLIWYELIRAMSDHRWQDAARLCRQLRFRARAERLYQRSAPWNSQTEHLIRMAEELCLRRRLEVAPDRPTAQEVDFRSPLLEQWAREAYNVKTEWEAALANGQLREACVLLSSVSRAALEGLLPDSQDPDLLLALPALATQAMEQTPALRRLMQEEFGPRGQIRLRQAIQAGDSQAVEMITVQFAGTQAALQARQWLGDRALAAGRFAEAAGHYRQALQQAETDQKPPLQARLQLALALQGKSIPGQPASALVLGGGPGQAESAQPVPNFPQLLEDLLRVRSAGSSEGTGSSPGRCPPPPGEDAALAVRQVLVAEGGSKKPDFVSSGELDWAGRETSAVWAGGLMVISSRCEHLAFDLAGARLVWRHWRHIPSAARPWPLLATQPVLVQDHVLVRRAIDGIHELVSLDRSSGRLLWSTTGDDYIASEALWADQAVWVFTVRMLEGQKNILSLLRLDPNTGRIQRRFPLLEFRSYSEPVVWCQAAVQDDLIVAAGAGVVFCCDLTGRVAWARRQTWVPPPGRSMYDARLWLVQRASPPIIQDRWVYVTQPGVWNVECIDLHTGRLRWRATLSELVGLAGMMRNKLIIWTTEGLAALDSQSGRVLWRHDIPGRQEGWLCGEPGGLLYCRVQPSGDPNRQPPTVLLGWIDPERGTPVGEYPVPFPPESKPLVGPLLSDGQRLWAFHGKADDTARRVVFEVLLRPEPSSSGKKP